MKNLVSHKEAVNRVNASEVSIPTVSEMGVIIDGRVQKVKVDCAKAVEGLLFTDFSAGSLIESGSVDLLSGESQLQSSRLSVSDAIGSADSAIEIAGLYNEDKEKKEDK